MSSYQHSELKMSEKFFGVYYDPDMFLEYDPRRTANFLRDCEARTLRVIFKPPFSLSAAIGSFSLLQVKISKE